jgi:hypothetical protein
MKSSNLFLTGFDILDNLYESREISFSAYFFSHPCLPLHKDGRTSVHKMERGKKEFLSPFPLPLWERVRLKIPPEAGERDSIISEIITFVLVMSTRPKRRIKENGEKGAQMKYKKVISCHFEIKKRS